MIHSLTSATQILVKTMALALRKKTPLIVPAAQIGWVDSVSSKIAARQTLVRMVLLVE